MQKILFLPIIILFFMAAPIGAIVINIPDDYPTIQQGIDASTDGDTVLVQPGTYVENINFNGHNIALGSLFLTTGDTSYIASTKIDGSNDNNAVTFENGENENARLVGITLFASQLNNYNRGILIENSSPLIEWNIIRDFYFIGPGAGILIIRASGPIIRHNIIIRNDVDDNNYFGGGGIALAWGSNPTIIENYIAENSAGCGGGIWCGGNPQFFIGNNVIEGNHSFYPGGGISCEYVGRGIISGNIIINNRSIYGGMGISSEGGMPIIDNNMIRGNLRRSLYALDHGGGIYCYSDHSLISNNLIYDNNANFGGGVAGNRSDAILINNIILANYGDSLGNALHFIDGSDIVLLNSIVRTDTLSNDDTIFLGDSSIIEITYSNIERGWEGEGNIDVDPLFRDPDNGDFYLMSTACGDPFDSPCVDAGDPNIIDSLLDCSWGLGGQRSDMGAYGGGDSVVVGIDDYIIDLPDKFALHQNYPNPFNAATVIRYTLPEPTDVRIEIFDILGRLVESLIDENQQPGYHQITWNPDEHPSGVYFARLVAGERSENIKMVLLK